MPVISTFIGSKIAIGALALAALGGGGAVVAVAASDVAVPTHSTSSPSADPTESPVLVAAEPAPSSSPEATHSPTGPDVTGPSAFGLCTAYSAGGLGETSVPLADLRALAGDDGVEGYCDLVVAGAHPGPSDEHGKSAVGEHAPVLPDQASQGIDHRPAEHPGR